MRCSLLAGRPVFAIAFAIAVTVPNVVSADGLVRTRPKDGEWCRFRLEGRDGPQEDRGTLTISFLRTIEIDGHEFRWVEMDKEGGDFPLLVKVLVPAEAFGAGNPGLAATVRGWSRRGEKPVEPFRRKGNDDELRSGLALLFAPLEEPGKLDSKRRIVRDGKTYSCSGRRGTLSILEDDEGSERAWLVEKSWITHWLNDEAPWGVEATQVETSRTGSRSLDQWSVTLETFGTGAVSKLPDRN